MNVGLGRRLQSAEADDQSEAEIDVNIDLSGTTAVQSGGQFGSAFSPALVFSPYLPTFWRISDELASIWFCYTTTLITVFSSASVKATNND